MAWHDNMIMPLRVLINDFSDSPTYTDEVLKRVLVVAASYVHIEVNLPKYTLNFNSPSISPDPSDDEVYTSFVVMKAACMTNQWHFNSQAISQGIRARCGPVDMEVTTGAPTVLTALLNEGFCKAYEEMQMQYNFGNIGIFKGILTPFAHSEYQFIPPTTRNF